MKLAVRQFGIVIGELESTVDRGIVFRYRAEHVANQRSRPLSQSLPLRDREYSQKAALPFFAGLLPDGELRRRIAEALHVSETSSLRLLEALGGECAGTVSIEREDDEGGSEVPQDAEGYDELPRPELEHLIVESERLPLLVPRGGARLSLAGAQEKIPLLYRDGRWFRPRGSDPTSHILKPASPLFPDIVCNEYAVMRLAGFLALPVADVDLSVIGKPVLIVRRYDRRYHADGTLQRLHQEDFCQALGIMPDRKYQSDGGPGFAEIAELIRKTCTAPPADLERVINVALFNASIGNCDAHGKNFSLLYETRSVGLAPFYDLVATTHWPHLDTKLSMRLGRTYRLADLGANDLSGLARDLGVGAKAVRRSLEELQTAAPAAWDRVFDLSELQAHISTLESLKTGWQARMRQLLE